MIHALEFCWICGYRSLEWRWSSSLDSAICIVMGAVGTVMGVDSIVSSCHALHGMGAGMGTWPASHLVALWHFSRWHHGEVSSGPIRKGHPSPGVRRGRNLPSTPEASRSSRASQRWFDLDRGLAVGSQARNWLTKSRLYRGLSFGSRVRWEVSVYPFLAYHYFVLKGGWGS